MLSNVKGIVGQDKERPRMNCFMASHDPLWINTYRALKLDHDRRRVARGYSVDADWFLLMKDETKHLLPSLEVMADLEDQLHTITTEFWVKALNLTE